MVDTSIITASYDEQIANLQAQRAREDELLKTANGKLSQALANLNGAKDAYKASQDEILRHESTWRGDFTRREGEAYRNYLSLARADLARREEVLENATIAYNDALDTKANHQNKIDAINLEIQDFISQRDQAVKDALRSDPDYLKAESEKQAKILTAQIDAESKAENRKRTTAVVIASIALLAVVAGIVIYKRYQ